MALLPIYDPLLDDIRSRDIQSVISDPASGKDGDTILNIVDDQIKIWYAGMWQVLHTLTGVSSLLLESGDFLLQEDGYKIYLE